MELIEFFPFSFTSREQIQNTRHHRRRRPILAGGTPTIELHSCRPVRVLVNPAAHS
jgi:hypothetical protein